MAKSSTRIRKALILFVSVAAVGGAAWGVRSAMRSPMFVLQVVEVGGLPEASPVDAQSISDLADLPVGRINLFDLELKPVEERVLSHAWVREVRLEKHFPQTLSISVTLREPQALVQSENGALSYLDVDGKRFGQVSLMVRPDLPLLSASCGGHALEALQIVEGWEKSELAKIASLSTLQWDGERGFRALVTYAIEPPAAQGATGRAFVDLGQDLDAQAAKAQFERLTRVFQYLSRNRVMARQIWADSDKKIVVKTTHGS